jgi:chloramphenicol 3-O-phosphotransferase
MSDRPGTIIVLNGASSAGRTSLLSAVQAALPDPFLDAGLDKFRWMLPSRYRRAPLWDDVLGRATQGGAAAIAGQLSARGANFVFNTGMAIAA